MGITKRAKRGRVVTRGNRCEASGRVELRGQPLGARRIGGLTADHTPVCLHSSGRQKLLFCSNHRRTPKSVRIAVGD
jgi:hypothetical protein